MKEKLSIGKKLFASSSNMVVPNYIKPEISGKQGKSETDK